MAKKKAPVNPGQTQEKVIATIEDIVKISWYDVVSTIVHHNTQLQALSDRLNQLELLVKSNIQVRAER